MRRDWLKLCRRAACSPADYWSGGKKILRRQTFSFPDPTGPIDISDAGYTKTKMSLLRKAYVVEESRAAAIDQWNNRKNYKEKSHWSVSFHCHNHTVKSHHSEAGIGSKMGPCLQAVSITHTVEGVAEVDVFYRTTELFKKFPADLVLLRDHLLVDFDFDRTPLGDIHFHVVNMTVSPTYLPTPLSLIDDPVDFMDEVLESDPDFHRIACRWMIQLIAGPESSFNQARRVQKAVKELMPQDSQEALVAHVNKCYPDFTP